MLIFHDAHFEEAEHMRRCSHRWFHAFGAMSHLRYLLLGVSRRRDAAGAFVARCAPTSLRGDIDMRRSSLMQISVTRGGDMRVMTRWPIDTRRWRAAALISVMIIGSM